MRSKIPDSESQRPWGQSFGSSEHSAPTPQSCGAPTSTPSSSSGMNRSGRRLIFPQPVASLQDGVTAERDQVPAACFIAKCLTGRRTYGPRVCTDPLRDTCTRSDKTSPLCITRLLRGKVPVIALEPLMRETENPPHTLPPRPLNLTLLYTI